MSSSAWAILTEELDWNPAWSSSELREEDATDALLFLTRWLDSGVETLLRHDRERGRDHAARFVPLPHDLTARPVLRLEPSEPSVASVGLPDDLDVDACYWAVREIMGDVTADANRRVVQELGGTSGLWRGWVASHFEILEEHGGRAPGPIAGWICSVHPPATG